MSSNQQIISDLKLMQETDQELELLNTYKGVPLTFKARILSIEEEKAKLCTEDPLAICLEEEKITRLLGNDFFDPAIASVLSYNAISGIIELGNFSYSGAKLGDRMIVRVEPKDAIEVKITNEDRTIITDLVDISISGIGIRILNANYTPFLKPGTVVQMDMHLDTGDISLGGMILSITKTPDFYRLSIRFAQNDNQKILIFRYLIDRRAEIRQELKQHYNQVRQSTSSSS